MAQPSRIKDAAAAPEFRKDVVRAIQAIGFYAQDRGEGSDQYPPPSANDCRLALDWIIQECARYYDNGFIADDPNGRKGAFIDGRQFVGKQILMAMQLKPELFEK